MFKSLIKIGREKHPREGCHNKLDASSIIYMSYCIPKPIYIGHRLNHFTLDTVICYRVTELSLNDSTSHAIT